MIPFHDRSGAVWRPLVVQLVWRPLPWGIVLISLEATSSTTHYQQGGASGEPEA